MVSLITCFVVAIVVMIHYEILYRLSDIFCLTSCTTQYRRTERTIMPVANHSHSRFRNGFIFLLVTGVAVGFLGMIHDFLIALRLTTEVAGLLYSVCWYVRRLVGDRAMLA